ncbi:hypothetical protein BaRGS_00029365 [Batillaria attramentaria]|uniref:Uncharacterized protein n=1 Tax=Batillaria attramentaria TaxID=370345 RepID=A0ABD0JWQ6_9CAEN
MKRIVKRMFAKRRYFLVALLFTMAVSVAALSRMLQRKAVLSERSILLRTNVVDRDRSSSVRDDVLPCEAVDGNDVGLQNGAPAAARLPVARDVRVHEPWPEVQRKVKNSAQMFETVHLLWCGKKILELRHYLSILSVFRVVQPLKIVMHYTDLPRTNGYHSWFREMNNSLPNLEMQLLPQGFSCDSKNMLMTALDFLSQSGGVYIGENTILSRFPEDAEQELFWSACSNASYPAEYTVMFASRAFNASKKETFLQSVLSRNKMCPKAESYNSTDMQRPECLILDKTIFPRDFWRADTPFAEFARWLFYGKRAAVCVEREGEPIPRISHYVRIYCANDTLYANEMAFAHFLSVLSALYIGGFERVYVHGDVEPEGPLWKELLKENVTFVKAIVPETVYQQNVNRTVHKSDLTRYFILNKYGGAYQDWDVIWVQRVPDWLLTFPAILSRDWQTLGWPDNLNNGVMLTRPRSHWLHHFLATHRVFRDSLWGYNSLMMSYRTVELYPRTIYIDDRLQVLCHRGHCHPVWMPGRNYGKGLGEPEVLLQDARAVHVTHPDPPPSLISLDDTRKGRDLYATMGRLVLERSGRRYMLE